MRKPPPLLTPRIIADLRAGEECGDPDHPGLRVRRTNAALALVLFTGCRSGEVVAALRLDIDLERAASRTTLCFPGKRSTC